MNERDLFQILVVDDDHGIRKLMASFLQENGYEVVCAANAAEARAALAAHLIHLMILDIMMPGEDGLELTKSLRANDNTTPILLLTARDALEDRILGLDHGADDYLTKPFEPRELLARLKAILRRVTDPIAPVGQEIRLGDYSFAVEQGALRKEQTLIFLSSTEKILLKTLAQKPHHPFARQDLAQRLGHRVSERSVDVQITRLRRKLGDDPRQPKYIQTVRHIGYVLCPTG